MVNRRKQSWLRWRHRHDSCSTIRSIPSRPKCSRSDASSPLLNRCFFIGTLLEAVAPPKYLATRPRCHHRHRFREFHLKRHIRCPSKESRWRNCLSICHIRIFSAPNNAAPKPRYYGQRTCYTFQNMAWRACRYRRRYLFNTCAHGGTDHRHVSFTTTVGQPNVRCNNNCALLLHQLG